LKIRSRQLQRSSSMFLRQAFEPSTTVGGIVPSGQALARKMVSELPLDQGWVLELGPGTGVFTQELLARGLPPERLLLVESNTAFVEHLTQRFPNVRIVLGDARNLRAILASVALSHVSNIISGLPFRSFDSALRNAIASAIGEVLAVGGVLVQFTYATRPPLPAEAALRAGLVGKRRNLVLANMPPAFVWRYQKMG
jgi:phosphatidylethanolamine/phosphatidyl-N-methylethanolamine N-methyltransferase